jgi:hypothetical protein
MGPKIISLEFRKENCEIQHEASLYHVPVIQGKIRAA